MALKIVLLLVFSAVVVNSYSIQQSEERRSWLERGSSSFSQADSDQRMKAKRSDESSYYASQQQMDGRQFERRTQRNGESVSYEQTERNQNEERSVRQDGKKIKINLSSSSEEDSSESHEIKHVQKQYHEPSPYRNGNSQLERSEMHEGMPNSIYKEM